MKKLFLLSVIGFVAGLVLMWVLKLVLLLTGNTAYILLFNFDYIPVARDLKPIWLFGYVFHFMTCIVSVIALFYILKRWSLHHKISPYVLVYMLGGGGLFFLTALSAQPPASDDVMAWLYWTLAHGIYGLAVGVMAKKML